jgi:hypothetical protein
MEGMNWRKSSYSGANGGNCTEVATTPGAVLVRDSKDPDGARLAFSAKEWRTFMAKVKQPLAAGPPLRVRRCS